MIENLYSLGFVELGNGKDYGRHNVEPRNRQAFLDIKSIINPKLVVEIGSWEGASALCWCQTADKVICVDTWLGSIEHYRYSGFEWGRERLQIEDHYPTIFRTFADNIRRNGYQDKVIPITIDASQAYLILEECLLDIDLIYIDGAHDYYSVLNDLRHSYSLVSNGYVSGDDYFGEIERAVQYFINENNLYVLSKDSQYILFDEKDNIYQTLIKAGWQ